MNLFESSVSDIKTAENAVYLEAVTEMFNVLFETTINMQNMTDEDRMKLSPRSLLNQIASDLLSAVDEAAKYSTIAKKYMNARAVEILRELVEDNESGKPQINDTTFFRRLVQVTKLLCQASSIKAGGWENTKAILNREGVAQDGIDAFAKYHNAAINTLKKRLIKFTSVNAPSMYNKATPKDPDSFFTQASSRPINAPVIKKGSDKLITKLTRPNGATSVTTSGAAAAPEQPEEETKGPKYVVPGSENDSRIKVSDSEAAPKTDDSFMPENDSEGDWLTGLKEKTKKPVKDKPKEEDAGPDISFLDFTPDHIINNGGSRIELATNDVDALISHLNDALNTVAKAKRLYKDIAISYNPSRNGVVMDINSSNNSQTLNNVLMYCLYLDAKKNKLVGPDNIRVGDETVKSLVHDHTGGHNKMLLRLLNQFNAENYQSVDKPTADQIKTMLGGEVKDPELLNKVAAAAENYISGYTASDVWANDPEAEINPVDKEDKMSSFYGGIAQQVAIASDDEHQNDIELSDDLNLDEVIRAMAKAGLYDKLMLSMKTSLEDNMAANDTTSANGNYLADATRVVEACRNELSNRARGFNRYSPMDFGEDEGDSFDDDLLDEPAAQMSASVPSRYAQRIED
jgi:hypothetical protein